ncbi:hypothetical protein F5Y05DRAFT_372745 [Hypoxylon sp. FL0543]|nr:hypothetical protein F5Y05DRAFT_372745 [Hypoxylon sp. FL0543]
MSLNTGTLINSLPHNGPGKTDIIVETILLALSYVSVGLRLWSRRIQRAQWQLNDWLILVAMPIMTLRYALEVTVVLKCGFGLHVTEVIAIGGPDLLVLFPKLVYIVDICWVTLVTLIKFSILHFYLKIFRQPTFVRAVYATMGLCMGFWFGAFFATVLFCNPPKKQWLPDTPGHCGDSNLLYVSCASTDLGIDVIIIMLPMVPLWGLQLPRAKKIALTFVFGMGFLTIAITAIRIKYMRELDVSDPTYSFSTMGLFSAIVPLLGITTACLPLAAPAFKKITRSSLSLASSMKKSTRTGNSSRQFAKLAEPGLPLVNLNNSSQDTHNTPEANHIVVTTDWEVQRAPTPDRVEWQPSPGEIRYGKSKW